MLISDINGDEIKDIIVTADNNSFRGNPVDIFMLSGDNVNGQAPPYYGDAPTGTEIWYFLVTPIETHISSLRAEDRNGDGLPEVAIGLSDSCFFYLNYAGEIVGTSVGSRCEGTSRLIRLDEK